VRTSRVASATELWEESHKVSETAAAQSRCVIGRLWAEMESPEKDYFAAYIECRQNGCNPKLADMLASQQGPGLLTDTTFMSDRWNGGIPDNKTRVAYKQIAEKAGVHAEGKQYVAGLANAPGDPSAWVDSMAEVKAKCERRGWNCQGAVSVQSSDPRPPTRKSGNVKDRLRKAGLPVAE
jgi:hypothetical protein